MAFAEFLQDLRYTIRVLRRDAGFAAFAPDRIALS